MKKYLEKMLVEKSDLEGKIKRAKKTIDIPPYGMCKTQLSLLEKQVNAMEEYLNCLKLRIDNELK